MNTQVINAISTAEILRENIFYIKYKENIMAEEQDIIASYYKYLELGKGKRMKKLVEVGKNTYFNFNFESIRQLAENRIKPLAEAFVTESLALRINIQHCHSIDGGYEKRIFKTKAKALAWLNSI